MEYFSDNLIKLISSYHSEDVYILYAYINSEHRMIGIFSSEEEAKKCGEDETKDLYECILMWEFRYLKKVPWNFEKENVQEPIKSLDAPKIPLSAECFKYIIKKTLNKPQIPYFDGCYDGYYPIGCRCKKN